MDNIIYYSDMNYNGGDAEEIAENERFNELLKEKYSPDFWAKAKAVGDFIKGLPITVEDNDRLVSLMLEHLTSVTSETFYIAFELGIQAAQSAADDTQAIE